MLNQMCISSSSSSSLSTYIDGEFMVHLKQPSSLASYRVYKKYQIIPAAIQHESYAIYHKM